ncbi:MAG: mannose-1-phosphate guanylyltransferase/mannose-6-phosphate isomerase [Phreatobacter sp.]|uniref:mannose-1-phosphate guanylyltransferase/mannose-6-phosphate isomerase n=1 Tax=Phreatobacter sp. TaxID=1966341 RepID=UPI001A48FBF8|nr:mannose-1-phosphate guanylyltransferase/mannose-6-phosphate isomerase [Phreatobacter sp.]MBL8571936.1 mannose-1-phosphate guanylyltransferase/mannose-6-phosphate isomerase [Phreatobacter sp.]
MAEKSRIVPVILSGGAGTRLWPASREAYPKQFLPLLGERSTFEETLRRVADPDVFADPVVVTGEDFRFLVADQLARAGTAGRIVLEPMRRDSGPAIAVAAELIAAADPDAVMLVLAADHLVSDAAAFAATAQAGLAAAEAGALVTFGIRPTHPATGYGYIRPGDMMDGRVRMVAAFVEKPDEDRARAFLGEGYLWNSGNFLFRADVFLAELARFEPAIAAAAKAVAGSIAVDKAGNVTFERIDREAFAASPAKSVDYAVMERTDRAAVIEADYAWSDLGSWEALWDMADKDEAGNAVRGAVSLSGTRNSYVASDDIHTAVIGLDDVAVVATKDAVLVAKRSVAAELKGLVADLRSLPETRRLADEHRQVLRPWGSYESVDRGERFQVKRIVVKPGARLSLQKHFHRAEHWIVVKGTATVEVDGKATIVRENESAYIPLGAWHRLTNEGKIQLELIEVQSGSYLGEDDIVRSEDDYKRV